LSRRLRRLFRSSVPILQCAVAAGLAWAVAKYWVGHPQPYFAPVAAIVSLGASLGQRLRRSLELVAGVCVGLAVGDLLVSLVGTGAWQIGLVVALAMSTAVLLDSGTVIVSQAASASVLVATLSTSVAGGGLRVIDGVVGGVIGFVIAAVIPANPLVLAHRNGRLVLAALADALRGVATAIERHDYEMAADVLSKARSSQRSVEEFRSALQAGREIVTFAPIHRGARLGLNRYEAASVPIDRALRNTRVLARRAMVALRDGELTPAVLPELLEGLAGSVVLLRDELASGAELTQARASARSAAKRATVELLHDGDFSMQAVVLQVRSIAVDLLQATGMSRTEALGTLPPLHPLEGEPNPSDPG
jgi:uncharacterized membrane protein YgaE (UPF0421/DUF939 family)